VRSSGTYHARMRTLDVDLTDLTLDRDGFPHELFVDLRAQGTVVHHQPVAFDTKPEGMEFGAVCTIADCR
jgi:hypothetical protein